MGQSFRQGARFAERLRYSLESTDFDCKSKQINVTASVGYVHANAKSIDDINSLIKISGEVLHKSKF